MRIFDITPKEGVGSIRIGMSLKDVQMRIGLPDHIDRNRHWHFEGMAIDYDSVGRVEFIEVSHSTQFKVFFSGICLIDVDAEEAVRFLESFARYDQNDPELGYSYVFPDLQIALWRSVIPDESQAPDDLTGRCFEAVGIGRDGYFSNF